jgi:hypothetical protein
MGSTHTDERMEAMTEYLIFTLIAGAVLLIGAKVYMKRELSRIEERDKKFKAEIAKVRKMRATPAQ